jgi:hypothetical protein
MLWPFFQWCESTALSKAISSSPWAFAVIESMHLLALAVIGGAVLVVDLRLLGFGLRDQRIADVARNAFPWLVGSLIVMLLTGMGADGARGALLDNCPPGSLAGWEPTGRSAPRSRLATPTPTPC